MFRQEEHKDIIDHISYYGFDGFIAINEQLTSEEQETLSLLLKKAEQGFSTGQYKTNNKG